MVKLLLRSIEHIWCGASWISTPHCMLLFIFFFRYEKAICEYERCLDAFQVNDSNDGNTSDLNSSLSSAVLNFLVNEVTFHLPLVLSKIISYWISMQCPLVISYLKMWNTVIRTARFITFLSYLIEHYVFLVGHRLLHKTHGLVWGGAMAEDSTWNEKSTAQSGIPTSCKYQDRYELHKVRFAYIIRPKRLNYMAKTFA